jgi:hypothetical protein
MDPPGGRLTSQNRHTGHRGSPLETASTTLDMT